MDKSPSFLLDYRIRIDWINGSFGPS